MMDANLIFSESEFWDALTGIRFMTDLCEAHERRHPTEEIGEDILLDLMEEIDIAIDRLDAMAREQDLLDFTLNCEMVGSEVLVMYAFGSSIFILES